MAELSFDKQVVVITGAGAGLGKAYALFFASRGANVVVNDYGTSVKGDGSSKNAADSVVQEIIEAGGNAVGNYDSVENGDRIIQTAISSFGRVDVLINNAGVLRDVSFKNMTDLDWDIINAVHIRGVYKCTHHAWSHFKKQKYGRVINVSSAAGLYGNFGQCNYAAAKLAMVGFTETLAKEGVKYNILCNVIAPIATSRMSATIMPPEMLKFLGPEWVVPLVAVLAHPRNTDETGSIFEVGAGHIAKMRWERSIGATLKCDETMTPGAVLEKWADVNDFAIADHPITTANMVAKLEESRKMQSNPVGKDIRFDGKVVLVTGGGAGLGRAYCLQFARLGASVVVNDLMNPDTVVQEIRSFGGTAVGNKSSVEDGEAVIRTAIESFGRIDILINNAGILRDKAFGNMTEKLWDETVNVHLRATYKCTKAAYGYMLKQKYGRIVNTTSTSGIYGNFGQANYAAAKTGILGFSRALALEGRKNNIYVNTIAPSAGTNLTRTVLSEELVNARKPDFVAPLVLLLCSDEVPDPPTGQLFEVGCGWQGRTRWQRSGGHDFPLDKELTPEAVQAHWSVITNFDDGRADSPENNEDARKTIVTIARKMGSQSKPSNSYLAAIEKAKNITPQGTEFSYTDRDVILYNLSLGANRTQLPLVYEGSKNFRVLPTFGVISASNTAKPFDFAELVPNFSFKMLLHGEQYLEIRKHPIPTSTTIVNYSKLVEVVDKSKASVITIGTISKDAKTGEDLFYNETTVFVRGSGGFGGPKTGANRGGATAAYQMPKRSPDVVVEEKTSEDQAALYRLNGDRNPLHIDPEVSRVGGFKEPILHGLCSFGMTGKHITASFGEIKSIKARFTGTVVPGQTLVFEMWKDSKMVIFQTKVKETGTLCMSGGGAELLGAENPRL